MSYFTLLHLITSLLSQRTERNRRRISKAFNKRLDHRDSQHCKAKIPKKEEIDQDHLMMMMSNMREEKRKRILIDKANNKKLQFQVSNHK